jgi:sec-independent protein translocase protein TatA
MGMPSGWELLLVVGVIVLLFGGKKIPELAKGLGKGIKDFKKAVNEDDEPQSTAGAGKEIEDKTAQTASAEAAKETDKA